MSKTELPTDAVAGLAVDYWKLLRVADRMIDSLPENKQKRISAQLRFSAGRFEHHLREMCLSLPTFEGQLFGPELPAVAVNADQFENAENLFVDSVIEPAVVLNGRVIETARVMLTEGSQDVSGD